MSKPHILLVSLDTVRRDDLSCYGNPRSISPQMDQLATGGAMCAESVANCGWTLPQHATLFTGQYPHTHGLIAIHECQTIPENTKLISEHLKEQGYRTFSGVSNRNPYGGSAAVLGFARGFDVHRPEAEYVRHMDWTSQFIIESFEQNCEEAPCFVYVHVNDPHAPFDAPEPWRSMWGQTPQDRHEAEVTYVDHYLGVVFARLKELGVWDDTLVVIFSDHGVEFGEHGFDEKKVNVYNEILNVPLIFHCPSLLPAGQIVTGLCESAQVTATILDVAGLPPMPSAQGESLAPRLRGEKVDGLEYVVSHTAHDNQRFGGPLQFNQFAIQDERYKFIRTELLVDPEDLFDDWIFRMRMIMTRARRDPSELKKGAIIRELYDLQNDPGETRSLLPGAMIRGWSDQPRGAAPANLAIAEDLEEKMNKWVADKKAEGEKYPNDKPAIPFYDVLPGHPHQEQGRAQREAQKQSK